MDTSTICGNVLIHRTQSGRVGCPPLMHSYAERGNDNNITKATLHMNKNKYTL